MKLKCSPIYSYLEFIKNTDYDTPGVYIWGFLINKIFCPYYVGKHQKSILSRIKQHWSHDLLKGNHHILIKDNLDNFSSIIQVDKIVKRLSELDFDTYESYFAYLNINKKIPRKAKNSKKELLKNDEVNFNQEILPHIQNYQNRFYVCCIPAKIDIPELEKYVFSKLNPKVGKQYNDVNLKQFDIEFSPDHHLKDLFIKNDLS